MRRRHRILVVDDDQDILDLLKYNLQKDGYKVCTLDHSHTVVKAAQHFRPDLIVLDIMMEGKNGIELCQELRGEEKFKNTYIFFLTANSRPEVQKKALETGGDDLIEKVMGLRELTNKIKAVLIDKWTIHKYQTEIRVGDLRINRHGEEVFIGNHPVSLSRLEIDLLFFFAQNPRKKIQSRNLVHNLWGSNVFSITNSLNHYLLTLSKKLDNRLQQTEEDVFRFVPGKSFGHTD